MDFFNEKQNDNLDTCILVIEPVVNQGFPVIIPRLLLKKL